MISLNDRQAIASQRAFAQCESNLYWIRCILLFETPSTVQFRVCCECVRRAVDAYLKRAYIYKLKLVSSVMKAFTNTSFYFLSLGALLLVFEKILLYQWRLTGLNGWLVPNRLRVTSTAGAGCGGKGEERKTLPRSSPSHHTLRATREVVRDDWGRVRVNGANMYTVTYFV